jgi:hypothetical protein
MMDNKIDHKKNITTCQRTGQYTIDMEDKVLCMYNPEICCKFRMGIKIEVGNEYYCSKWNKED